MGKAIQYNRLFWLATCLVLALIALSIRLVDLQVVRHGELLDRAQGNTRSMKIREPLRGQTRDVHNNPLAMSAAAKRVCVDPTIIGDRASTVARALAPILRTNETWLLQQLTPRIHRYDTNNQPVFVKYVILAPRVPIETWSQIQAAMTNLQFELDESKLSKTERRIHKDTIKSNTLVRTKAVFAQDEQIRTYPSQSLAAHVVGYVGPDPATDLMRGIIGLEYTFNSKLTGTRGWLQTEKDRDRREIMSLRGQDVEPRDGLNVVTTLDARIQSIVEAAMAEAFREYSPINASCVVVRPKTGEILAMASVPNFDPNRYADARPDLFRNRIISDLCEPGSTFKIVVVSGGLQEGTVTLKSPFDCENGVFTYAKRTLHDHEKYGVLSVEKIITKSSNIGAAKIGIQLGEARLYDYMRRFGFGELTGIPLPAEARGIIPPVNKWSGVSIAQIPMGHGVAVTPLQMVMAMSAIANKGTLMRPMLVKRLEEPSGNVVSSWDPIMNKQVMGAAAARDMVEALKTVVLKDGTGPKAHLENYTVAGKTGTAQKVENGTYSKTKYFASFIGFFPADEPEICIGVFLDEPKGKGYYGGQVAAPAFQAIAEKVARYLNIRPDVQPEESGIKTISAKLSAPALTDVR